LPFANGMVGNMGYSTDGRQQLTSLQYTKGSQILFGETYGYTQNGGNNGQVTSVTDLVDKGRSVNYLYDAIGQLQQAYSIGSTAFPRWDLAFVYDMYGNRTDENILPDTSPNATVPSNHVLFSPTANTNRIITPGYSYDANGNLTNDGVNSLVYDAANRLVSINGGAATYSYDGYGLRVLKCGTSCAASSTVYAFSGSTVIAEYDNGALPASPSREYITMGGTPMAKIEGGTVQYYLVDRLSIRALVDVNGNKTGERGSFPFGEQWYFAGATTKLQFTTYERDSAETGNAFAIERYYVNRLGRLNAVDPANAGSWLHRYSYRMNDPINMTDSRGMFCSAELHIFDTCGFGYDGPGFVGPGMLCILDGVPTPCGTVLDAVDRGEAGQCRNNQCLAGDILGADGRWYSYVYHPATLTYYDTPNPDYDPAKGDVPGNQPIKPTLRIDTGGWSLDPLNFDSSKGGGGVFPTGPDQGLGGGGGGAFAEKPVPAGGGGGGAHTDPDPCIATRDFLNPKLKESADEWHAGSGISAVGTLVGATGYGAPLGGTMKVVGAAMIVDAWSDELAIRATSWTSGCGWSW